MKCVVSFSFSGCVVVALLSTVALQVSRHSCTPPAAVGQAAPPAAFVFLSTEWWWAHGWAGRRGKPVKGWWWALAPPSASGQQLMSLWARARIHAVLCTQLSPAKHCVCERSGASGPVTAKPAEHGSEIEPRHLLTQL